MIRKSFLIKVRLDLIILLKVIFQQSPIQKEGSKLGTGTFVTTEQNSKFFTEGT